MLIPVILSGGAGTRLWPVSREGQPKPFMVLPDGQTLLGKTYRRAAGLIDGRGDIVTVTNRDYYFQSKDHYQGAGLERHRGHFLLEPTGRNTAPALAAAALAIEAEHGDAAIMVVMPADHLILDEAALQASVEHAVRLAKAGYLVTFGVVPTAPETGFGYIEAGAPLDDQGAAKVQRFVEKPDVETATHYVESGQFLWNSGMFCFSVATLLAELHTHAPQLLEQARACVLESNAVDAGGCLQQELNAALFAELQDISIDYAVMEHSDKVAVVPAAFDWSDIGSWNAVAALVPADAHDNRASGDAVFIDSRSNFVQTDRLVATVGVDHLIIVDTADAVLVAHADRAQDVRRVAKQLKDKQHEAYRLHRTVSRPWGTYTVLEEGPRFKIKRIVVKPGAKLSLQMHHHRNEHWVVVEGMAKVTNNGTGTHLVAKNESTFIAAGHKHRLENPGVIDLVIIEVQSGEYLGEDDIVRFEDQYGRTD
ncbi:mannose-1-phosphate guanylyltransferase/mannose-6-phosphate isomerase [Pseudomonas sp. SZMC_28357]|uniref:mannose-1-phosphate guanylyltransferase/mannose-6-phosphate isomerase n=1 Tax=Pseudomonas sp. SZMC_28357 TaxID=3074380 RepID=UPI002872380D|nr:mannose-1-phosphate guanylyltransferase/mannose-6-phosphate isomerase [Pseudomonas sp. SZMC_28357]MDR9751150.1 mannose-1-phosphate guanylyltransferase/mannose-6-phosphate isomerase [Pseudomonas sp. SZMC_28357]